jgi:hypothetical protein
MTPDDMKGFLKVGYNIFFGDPYHPNQSGIDPGVRDARNVIFSDVGKVKVTEVSISKSETESKSFKNVGEVSDEFNANLSTPSVLGAFSASAYYKSLSKFTLNTQRSSKLYKGKRINKMYEQGDKSELSVEFKAAVAELGVFNPADKKTWVKYGNFFMKFGTHYVTKVYAGATKMTTEVASIIEDKQTDSTKVGGSVAAYGVSAGMSYETNKSTTNTNGTTSLRFNMYGSYSDNGVTMSMPVDFHVKLITELIKDNFSKLFTSNKMDLIDGTNLCNVIKNADQKQFANVNEIKCAEIWAITDIKPVFHSKEKSRADEKLCPGEDYFDVSIGDNIKKVLGLSDKRVDMHYGYSDGLLHMFRDYFYLCQKRQNILNTYGEPLDREFIKLSGRPKVYNSLTEVPKGFKCATYDSGDSRQLKDAYDFNIDGSYYQAYLCWETAKANSYTYDNLKKDVINDVALDGDSKSASYVACDSYSSRNKADVNVIFNEKCYVCQCNFLADNGTTYKTVPCASPCPEK